MGRSDHEIMSSNFCSSSGISPWVLVVSVLTLAQDLVPSWELQFQATYGLMVGWDPCTGNISKFPDDTDATAGLGTTELEWALERRLSSCGAPG